MKNKWVIPIVLGSLFSAISPSSIAQKNSEKAFPLKTEELAICSYDRSAMLALDESAFDQNINGGWRTLARQEPCLGIAADLIRDYRDSHKLGSYILYWHEGQLRAMYGATADSIRVFEKSHDESGHDFFGWNIYVNATLAFLKQDKASLLNAREELAHLPKPNNLQPSRDPQGNVIEISWPPNLDVVDRLVACFGLKYKEAYRSCAK